jgi:hypothetical protein
LSWSLRLLQSQAFEFWTTELAYTTRSRWLSSITRAPCRSVIRALGQRVTTLVAK